MRRGSTRSSALHRARDRSPIWSTVKVAPVRKRRLPNKRLRLPAPGLGEELRLCAGALRGSLNHRGAGGGRRRSLSAIRYAAIPTPQNRSLMPPLPRIVPVLVSDDIPAGHDFHVTAFGFDSGGLDRDDQGGPVH